MSRTARLFQLMQAMRSSAPPLRAEALAADLGVSIRTLYRDIDSLRSLGAVIDGEPGFGYTLIEDATLPPLGFDDEEIEALVLGLKEVQQIGDPALAEAAARAMAKLKGRLPPSQSHRLEHAVLSARRFAPMTQPAIDTRVLRKAAWDERSVSFGYSDANGNRTSRSVDPLGLVVLDHVHCLLAFCHLREDFRSFRLDRMSDLTVLENSFRPRRVPMLREYVALIRAAIPPPTSADPRKLS